MPLLRQAETLSDFTFSEVPPSDAVLFFCGYSEACGHPVEACQSFVSSVSQILRHKLQHVWMSVVVFHPLHKFIDASLEESFPFTAVAHVEVGRVLLDLVAVWAS